MNENLQNLIIDTTKSIASQLKKTQSKEITLDTRLYGQDGLFDSLGLVTLIAELEARISEEFDKDVVLADEKAMSQVRSPFRDIKTLSEYIEKLLEGE
ncbi:MAG: hypothetical protein A2086_06055 [Spirochaetes bacterium GWD1_27_9]|nr:MAG: hypothetical protein A2Z98_10715 [Spirochaetes bacterium GWB1_27_13]OHD20353.1 MAG: hypothetical protein A2Y34_10290 [Spirochaetes bacterium GWC1_27_15]OHD35575.1 MAG: hypothetical protein A2086_06055 [Spirochaetes bacterium GWD1_27_9]